MQIQSFDWLSGHDISAITPCQRPLKSSSGRCDKIELGTGLINYLACFYQEDYGESRPKKKLHNFCLSNFIVVLKFYFRVFEIKMNRKISLKVTN